MNSKELDASRLVTGHGTIEANAIKKIVRESWESKLKEKGTTLDILNDHAEFMAREFGVMNYETLCMQNIAARAKHMSKGELAAYAHIVEALALGYKARFGPEFAEPLVAGVTLLAKDVKSARKHLDYFTSHVSGSADAYGRRIAREMERLELTKAEARKMDSGILRFFRKRVIARLGMRIRAANAKIEKLEGKRLGYARLAEETRERADRKTQRFA